MIRFRYVSVSVLAAWLSLLAGAVGPALADSRRPDAATPQTTGSIPSQAKGFTAARALAEVNSYRVSQGLTPVRIDPAVMQAAMQQSRAMGQSASMSHSIAGGLGSRLSQAGLGNVRAVENIAMGQQSWREVFDAWKQSASHDANLRASGMTRLGIAQAAGPNGPYWTLMLVGDAGKFW